MGIFGKSNVPGGFGKMLYRDTCRKENNSEIKVDFISFIKPYSKSLGNTFPGRDTKRIFIVTCKDNSLQDITCNSLTVPLQEDVILERVTCSSRLDMITDNTTVTPQ